MAATLFFTSAVATVSTLFLVSGTQQLPVTVRYCRGHCYRQRGQFLVKGPQQQGQELALSQDRRC